MVPERAVPYRGATVHDKGTPGQSRGRKATGPRSPPRRRAADATKVPTTAKLPTGNPYPSWRLSMRCVTGSFTWSGQKHTEKADAS